MALFSKGTGRPETPFALETLLLSFAPRDRWTIADACEGVQIFGATGSGKTSATGAAIARSFLAQGFGGIVLAAKPDERELWERYTQQTGRANDLVRIAPGAAWRFNFLDYELRHAGMGGGQTENVVNLLTAVVAIAEGKSDQGGGDKFWDRAMREMLRNAIDLLSIVQGKLTLNDIRAVILDAPQRLSQCDLDTTEGQQWAKKSFCAHLITEAANRQNLTPRQAHDLEIAADYWLKSYPALNDRTRTSIVATFTSVSDILLHGLAWELLCQDTTIVPEVTTRNGAILLLDLPVQTYGDLGRIIQGIFKFMWQKAVLRRNAAAEPRPVFLWADEAQNFVTSYDYQFQAVARSARACTVYLTQNISNYYSVLGNRDETHALLGNFQTKIFHSNSDHATNQYASELIGQEWRTTTGYSLTKGEDGQQQRTSTSGTEGVHSKVLPAAFTTLKKGGNANNRQVETIVFQGGRVWETNGKTFLRVTFHQR